MGPLTTPRLLFRKPKKPVWNKATSVVASLLTGSISFIPHIPAKTSAKRKVVPHLYFIDKEVDRVALHISVDRLQCIHLCLPTFCNRLDNRNNVPTKIC